MMRGIDRDLIPAAAHGLILRVSPLSDETLLFDK